MLVTKISMPRFYHRIYTRKKPRFHAWGCRASPVPVWVGTYGQMRYCPRGNTKAWSKKKKGLTEARIISS